MSGTSLDAIDAALVRIDGAGLAMRAAPLAFASVSLTELADPLRKLSQQTPMTSREIAELSREFSLRHVHAIRGTLLARQVDLIAVHGQTVYHAPPVSWQLLTPTVIAAALGVSLVYDLRAADLAAGGQGAPITPLADFILFRDAAESRNVVNLGGFANYTWLPTASDATDAALARIRGGDLCACNQLLDGLARLCLDRPFDDDGAIAASGRVVPTHRDRLLRMLATPRDGRSLGTADEPHGQLASLADQGTPADVLATACDAIAETIAAGLPRADSLLLAGGGSRNRHLAACIGRHTRAPIRTTGDFGVPVAQREAVEFAVLGALCQDRVPITLPQVTGCAKPAPLGGSWLLP
jgi:1,6-anhydro-N-acetylmuramate kinase